MAKKNSQRRYNFAQAERESDDTDYGPEREIEDDVPVQRTPAKPRKRVVVDDAVAQALRYCESILGLIEDDVPERAWDEASDFFEDIKDKVSDMQRRIERFNEVSHRQLAALANWERAVAKWCDQD